MHSSMFTEDRRRAAASVIAASSTLPAHAQVVDPAFGVSRTLDDQCPTLGAELESALIDAHTDRGEFEEELFVGPSLQHRASARMHIDIANWVGIGADSHEAQGFLGIGYEFRAASGRPGGMHHAASGLVRERGTMAGMPVVPRSTFSPA